MAAPIAQEQAWDDRTVRYDQVPGQAQAIAELERARAAQNAGRRVALESQTGIAQQRAALEPASSDQPQSEEAAQADGDVASDVGPSSGLANTKLVGARQAVRVSIAAYPGAPGFFVVRPLEDHQVPGQGAEEALVVILGSNVNVFEPEA